MQSKKVQIVSEVPIFPLPNVVFFPKTLLPLHIFEDRYRKMVRDAVAGSNQIGMALLKQGWDQDYFGSPEVYEIGCVGDIQFSEKLDDDKYNIMLYGLCRVKILKFIQERPYRIARVKHLKDTNFDHDNFNESYEAEQFLRSVRRYLAEMGAEKVDELLNFHAQSFESIMHQVASVLDFTTQEKQSLLEKGSLDWRFASLKEMLVEKLKVLKLIRNVKYVPEDPARN